MITFISGSLFNVVEKKSKSKSSETQYFFITFVNTAKLIILTTSRVCSVFPKY